MAAPRATQWIALRNLAKGSAQFRHLHMTGPNTYASPVLTKERPALNLPRDIASLRGECKRRKLETNGNTQDLLARIHAHELTTSRAFSIAVQQSKRPEAETDAPTAVRHFNVSRSLKANNDSSTIDFAYLPDFDPDNAEASELLRVPIISHDYSATARSGPTTPVVEEAVVMKPQISVMSADAVYLPMAEMSDSGTNIDFHAMADRVSANMRRMKVPVGEQAGMMKQIFHDIIDDMFGKKPSAAS
ncbi:hypothetical protein Tdes44962_MAKER06266 [Teratosphaeria destructans]|uniref:SAP domain-containing protein n=1 Tax=Teratosphaeria destructans TaxID=418781 RepID=A0A9W7SHU3_9PEZI|nr:hypothetical protein Tdes44962_MAKER06266 [Teratosphaeria destructans]